MTVADTLDGGAGTADALNVTFGTAAAGTKSLNGASISNIEVFNIKNVSSRPFSQDFGLIVGETTVNSNVSTNDVTVTNLASGTTFKVTGNGAATNGATNVGYDSNAATTVGALVIDGGVTAGAITVTGTKLTSQNITSSGAANTTGTITVAATTKTVSIDASAKLTAAITGTVISTLNITGSAAVDTNSAALDASVISIDGSTSTGDIDVTAGAVADATNPGSVDIADITIVTGSGADEVDVSNVDTARELSVTTGGGNDIITIGTVLVGSSASNAGDIIAAGDGDADVLQMTSAIAAGQTTAVTTVSGVEQITISNALAAAFTTAKFQAGIRTVNLAVGAAAGTVNFDAGENTVNIASSLTGTLTINDTGTATTDVVTIRNSATAADDMGDANNLVIGGFETVNIVTTGAGAATSQDFGTIGVTADTGGTATVNFSGANTATSGAITAQVVSAAGLTGTAKLTMGAAMVGKASGVNTLTGSDGDDTLVGDADDTTNISGGAGNDNITGGSDAETISGGAGNDIIAGGGGADTITGDAGKDQITLGGTTESVDAGDDDDTVIAAGNLTFGTTIAGGQGTDILSADAGVSAAAGSVVSGFETLSISAAGTMALANFGNNTFDTVTIGALGASTISGVVNENVVVTGVLAGDLTVTKKLATGTDDSQTITLKSAAALTQTSNVIVAGVETLNIVSDDTDTTAHQNTILLNADKAVTINVSGDAGLIIGGADFADVYTFNASGVVLGAVTDSGVTYAATYNQVGGVTTITGSNGVDSLTGGSNTNDTISGGSGVDTLVYTGGTDVFTGGAGNDVFDVNAVSSKTGLSIADAVAGDTIDFAGVIDVGSLANVDYTAAAWAAQKVTLGPAATLDNYLAAAAAGDGATGNEIMTWFTYGGDTYVVVDNTAAAAFTSATDTVVKLTGVTSISTATVADGVLTLA